MITETTLAETIRITNPNPKYDNACKRMFSEKILLARIMKTCIAEYKDISEDEIAEKYIEGQPEISQVPVFQDEEVINTEASSLIDGLPNEDISEKEKRVTYDIHFWAGIPNQNKHNRLIINIESQNKWDVGYPLTKRAVYYACRLISAQRGRDFKPSEYGRLNKVYSIWIAANPPKKYENTINRFFIAEEQLVGDVEYKKANYDLLSIVMIGLGKPDSPRYDGLLKMLEVLLSKRTVEEKKHILQEEFNFKMTENMIKEATEMCNLSQAIEDRGRELGKREGINIGIEQGRAEATFQTTLANIQSLITTLRLSAEQAMDALNIPQDERSQYLPKLKHLN